jgi:hypothetical protein
MVIDFIKTKDKNEAIAVLTRHLESGDPRYASMQYSDGEYRVGILELALPSLSLKFVAEEREESASTDWPLKS